MKDLADNKNPDFRDSMVICLTNFKYFLGICVFSRIITYFRALYPRSSPNSWVIAELVVENGQSELAILLTRLKEIELFKKSKTILTQY